MEDLENPVVEPVTLEEVKTYCKIDFPDEDVMIEEIWIVSARQWVEDRCAISLIPKKVTAYLYVNEKIRLPYGPVSGEVTVEDATPDITEGPFPILLGNGQYKVEYNVGIIPVPEALKKAICAKVLADMEQRGDVANKNHDAIAKSFCAPYSRKTP